MIAVVGPLAMKVTQPYYLGRWHVWGLVAPLQCPTDGSAVDTQSGCDALDVGEYCPRNAWCHRRTKFPLLVYDQCIQTVVCREDRRRLSQRLPMTQDGGSYVGSAAGRIDPAPKEL